MENNEIEMSRFKQKALGYRTSHEIAPMARVLETAAIVNVIEGFRKKKHIARSELVIVDLMAGTGYLSKSLYRAGYRNLHAFERCNEMSQKTFGRDDCVHYALHPFADITAITDLLKQVRPHIIICLAGFHHLIEFEKDGKTVNIDGSVAIQERVVKVCMDALSDDGMLLLADIHEDGFEQANMARFPYWQNTKAIKTLFSTSNVPQPTRDLLYKTDGPQKFSTIVEAQLSGGRKENPALAWFRKVVDEISTAGHKDIPLTKKLAKKLSENYQVSTTSFSCPWIFPNRASLNNFLLTFWFDDFPRDSPAITRVFSEAESLNGIYVNGTFASFGWNLGFIAVEPKASAISTATRAVRRRLTLLFWILVALCAVNICLKLFTYWSGGYMALDKVISGVLGAIGAEVLGEWRRG